MSMSYKYMYTTESHGYVLLKVLYITSIRLTRKAQCEVVMWPSLSYGRRCLNYMWLQPLVSAIDVVTARLKSNKAHQTSSQPNQRFIETKVDDVSPGRHWAVTRISTRRRSAIATSRPSLLQHAHRGHHPNTSSIATSPRPDAPSSRATTT